MMDTLKIFPNQLGDGDPYECVALTIADIAGNILGVPINPDFTYAATALLGGVTPGLDPLGLDPWTGLQSAVGYGVLPQADALFTAKTKTELYASDFRNYTDEEKRIARLHQMVAAKNIGKDYDAMVAWMRKTGQGVIVPLTWYSGFGVAPDGNIPAPFGSATSHCVVAYLDSDNTTVLLKPWLGATWGRGGYGIFTRQLFNTIAEGCYAFDPNGSHTWALIGIIVTKYPFAINYISSLATIMGDTSMQTQNGTKLYNAAAAALGTRVAPANAIDQYGVLGCAITVNLLAKKAWGHQIGGDYSTEAMLPFLKDQSKFQSVLIDSALPGDIVISATGSAANAVLQHGHVGICGKYGILSNESESGTLQENYSLASWQAYFTQYGKLPTLIFRPV